LIAYFIGYISSKKYQNPFTCVKVIASQRWDVFETRCRENTTSMLPNKVSPTEQPSIKCDRCWHLD